MTASRPAASLPPGIATFCKAPGVLLFVALLIFLTKLPEIRETPLPT